MAKEVQVISWDDLELAEGKRVEATSTVIVGYNGTEVEIDLSEENRDALEMALAPFMKAGHKPDPLNLTPGGKRKYAKPNYGTSGDEWHRVRREKQALRDWADARVAENPALAEDYRYLTDSGNYFPRTKLKRDYAAYLASQEAAGS